MLLVLAVFLMVDKPGLSESVVALHVRTLGAGPPLLLVHGGVGPEITWAAQEPLADRFTLLIPHRRGFPPSPPAARQDWMADAEDLEALLSDEPAHGVGFSYGGLGLAVAAGRHPERLRSLTLIEVPLFELADQEDPRVRDLVALAGAYTGEADESHAEARAAFEALAGMGGDLTADQRAELERVRKLARGLRPPAEAHPDYAAIVRAGRTGTGRVRRPRAGPREAVRRDRRAPARAT